MGLGDMEETISLSNPLSKFSVLLSLVDVPYWASIFKLLKHLLVFLCFSFASIDFTVYSCAYL